MRPVLPVIVISQFFCTSVWFAGNSVLGDIASHIPVWEEALGDLVGSIQLGFITGTLVFAVFTIADRFSPARVFFVCALLAACANLALAIPESGATAIMFFRFLTGFFLAGIYPVGMKIASDYYDSTLGKSLGYLVGALVLGTALPHALKSMTVDFDWQYVVYVTSALSVLGGTMILLLVPDGPFRKASQKINFKAFLQGFRVPDFRAAAFGYFGHMWELYTFWAFVPVILAGYNNFSNEDVFVPLSSFIVIASGTLGCIVAGKLAQMFGAKKIAAISLFTSGTCCLVSPFFLTNWHGDLVLLTFLVVWGISVVADSPLFSTLVARNAPVAFRATSLTIVNCIGFAITIVSVQFLEWIQHRVGFEYMFMLLAIGPIFGLIALLRTSKP